MKIKISVAVAIIAISLFGAAPVGHAQCTTATLSAGWGYQALGTFTDTSSKLLEARIEAGLFTFDGAGHFTLKNSWSLLGRATKDEVSQGTYVLNSNCSGSLILHDGTTDLVHFSIQMNQSLNGFTMACTDSNAEVWNNLTKAYSSTYTGTAQKQ